MLKFWSTVSTNFSLYSSGSVLSWKKLYNVPYQWSSLTCVYFIDFFLLCIGLFVSIVSWNIHFVSVTLFWYYSAFFQVYFTRTVTMLGLNTIAGNNVRISQLKKISYLWIQYPGLSFPPASVSYTLQKSSHSDRHQTRNFSEILNPRVWNWFFSWFLPWWD